MKINKNLIILDMDGILYQFDGGSLKKFSLNKIVLANAKNISKIF